MRDRQTGRQTGRQADRQAGRQAGRQTDRQTDRQRYSHHMTPLSATIINISKTIWRKKPPGHLISSY